MSTYTQTTWVDDTTPLNATNLNHLEQGVHDAHDEIAVVSGNVTTLSTSKQDTLAPENRRKITYGTADPTGGVDGDIYFQY